MYVLREQPFPNGQQYSNTLLTHQSGKNQAINRTKCSVRGNFWNSIGINIHFALFLSIAFFRRTSATISQKKAKLSSTKENRQYILMGIPGIVQKGKADYPRLRGIADGAFISTAEKHTNTSGEKNMKAIHNPIIAITPLRFQNDPPDIVPSSGAAWLILRNCLDSSLKPGDVKTADITDDVMASFWKTVSFFGGYRTGTDTFECLAEGFHGRIGIAIDEYLRTVDGANRMTTLERVEAFMNGPGGVFPVVDTKRKGAWKSLYFYLGDRTDEYNRFRVVGAYKISRNTSVSANNLPHP